MIDTVVLDASPLGLASNPKPLPDGDACNQWIREILGKGINVIVPEIADYEVRRELLRAGKARGIARLNALIESLIRLLGDYDRCDA
jgi:hypothetical protein